jgi:DNA-binding phage protein
MLGIMRALVFGLIVCLVTLSGALGSARAASDQDKSFIQSALQDNADLRMLSNVAAKKVSSPKVKDFTKSVLQRLTQDDGILMPLAKSEDLKPPATLSLRASDQYSRIDAQSGKNATDEFLRDIAIDARITEDDYTNEAQTGTQPSLKRLAVARAADLEKIARQADALRDALH